MSLSFEVMYNAAIAHWTSQFIIIPERFRLTLSASMGK
jgi:hypothetical protein